MYLEIRRAHEGLYSSTQNFPLRKAPSPASLIRTETAALVSKMYLADWQAHEGLCIGLAL